MSSADPQGASVAYPLMEIESTLSDLSATIGILGHLIRSPREVRSTEWNQVVERLDNTVHALRQQWEDVWTQHKAERDAYEATLAVTTMEREAPGSLADAAYARSLWHMLRSVAGLIVEQCNRAEGFGVLPPQPDRTRTLGDASGAAGSG